ncbi:SH3 domain-containing protein [Calothrix sp. PCC 6303]|uniref:SH3 domain-containing protein n=1 Tax=Calothrix sp. PCC 6303 TaxID=1170562 RepID=UPI0002A05578|nr:SH3 domain-containing protein [Calothrix sp. PCC 6303]AFZ03225.1 SH3 type 3 domain protein [Calothrix sp. PCC 6303]
MSKSQLFKVLMASAVILSSALPASATPSISKQNLIANNSLQFHEGTLVSQSGTAEICTRDGDDLNMRSGPGTNFRRVYQVPSGAVVSVSNIVRRGRFYWYQITFRNQTGYVRGDFICNPT